MLWFTFHRFFLKTPFAVVRLDRNYRAITITSCFIELMYTRVLVAGSLRRGRFKRDRMKTTFSPVINTVTRAGLWPPPAFCPPPTSKFMSHDRTFPGCSGNVVSPSLRCIVKLDEKTRSNKFAIDKKRKKKNRGGGEEWKKERKKKKNEQRSATVHLFKHVGGWKIHDIASG